MKRILIIENRMSTKVWVNLLKEIPRNYSVALAVLNPFFQKQDFIFEKIYFIKKHRYSGEPQKKNHLNTSRSFRYFNININYESYAEEIKIILDDFQPDIVIGECTHFHEILFIEECIKKNILYIAPMNTRFPKGRFEFLLFDTDYPLYKNNNNKANYSQQLKLNSSNLVKKIKDNSELPLSLFSNKFYENSSYYKRLKIKYSYFIKIILTSLFVENLITPNILRKFFLVIKTRFFYKKIIKYDLKEINSSRRFFLYPMQLQPENNIDIFGIKFSNQSELILKLAKVLQKYDYDLYVKPNPVLRYQVNERLVDIVNSRSNVYFLNDGINMSELLDKAYAVCTVTGTVMMEAAARNLNIFAFAKTRLSLSLGIPIIDKVSDIEDFIPFLDKKKDYSKKLHQYLCEVHDTSFEGYIYDPTRDIDYNFNEVNIQKISSAFAYILENCVFSDIDLELIKPGRNISYNGVI